MRMFKKGMFKASNVQKVTCKRIEKSYIEEKKTWG